jgi:hypothetical protein
VKVYLGKRRAEVPGHDSGHFLGLGGDGRHGDENGIVLLQQLATRN